MRFISLTYYPTSNNLTFSILFENEVGERHSFRFWTNDEIEEGIVKRIFGEETSLLYKCQDNRIRIYSPPSIWGSVPDENGLFLFPMEIDGFYIQTRYLPEDISTVVPENIYRCMTVTSFKDAPWRTSLSTADALIILRSAVGLDLLTDAQIARFEISGAPTTADALRILRAVVGLPNVISGID
jgi:hypothetical protein